MCFSIDNLLHLDVALMQDVKVLIWIAQYYAYIVVQLVVIYLQHSFYYLKQFVILSFSYMRFGPFDIFIYYDAFILFRGNHYFYSTKLCEKYIFFA
jgi:hypothetical protein